ncbi:alpha/beta fold hydrolase [Variovorax paradoxus]|uniref:alpha/beta fold hydrolase n=1 Tax=Variovorax paradoxus TaxID=34073 RepID=UPI003ECE22C7
MTGFIRAADGSEIFYKDWGPRDAPAIVFHHGWPLSSDEWDAQMMFFLLHGFRTIAHDRRGHGRSSQTERGTDMEIYADDVRILVEHLDLKGAVHIGHSTGGGEATRYVARAAPGRVAKAVLVGAITPVMVRSAANPQGLPVEVFDGYRRALAANRAQLYLDIAKGPFYGFNRAGVDVSEATVRNWWRQGMAGAVKAHYDCIKVWSETDFTDDLKQIDVPVLVMHGDDDQVVPIADSALLSVKLLRRGELRVYKGYPHGMLTTHPDQLNADILEFIRR